MTFKLRRDGRKGVRNAKSSGRAFRRGNGKAEMCYGWKEVRLLWELTGLEFNDRRERATTEAAQYGGSDPTAPSWRPGKREFYSKGRDRAEVLLTRE